jgi:hypothetical protein
MALETHRSWDPAFSTVASFLPSFLPSYFSKTAFDERFLLSQFSIVCKITSINKDFSEKKGRMLRRWSSLYAVLSSCFAEITYGLLRAESS